jgi:curved DNA-binding protein CbpA
LDLDAHYRVLGLQPGSPLALVKKAYLREIKTWHPDRYAPDSSLRKMAEERAKALTAAYATLRAALGDSRAGEIHTDAASAAAKDGGEPPESTPQNGPSGWQWLEQLWRHLKQQKRADSSTAGPATAERRAAKRAVTAKGGGRKASTFNQFLDEARHQPTPPSDNAAAWRRLAARRARYQHRRRGAGATAIDPISPRGPVTPVTPVRPIGKDD